MVRIQRLSLGAIHDELQERLQRKAKLQEPSQKAFKAPDPAPGPAAGSAAGPSVSGHPVGQRTWEAVRALLPEKVLRLERCKPMFEDLLADLRISVWLPKDTHIVQHVKQVANSLLPGMRFKIGVTVDPNWRYYEAGYAYCKNTSHERDGVRYEGMIVVYAHPVRDVVCAFETSLITQYRADFLFKKGLPT